MSEVDLYEQARRRVNETPALDERRDVVLYEEWANDLEHWEWVTTAEVSEIVAWADAVGDALAANPLLFG